MKFGDQPYAQVVDAEVVYDDWSDEGPGFADPRYGRVSTVTRPSITYVNEAGIPEDVIDRHFRRGKGMREIASIVEQWTQSLNDQTRGTPSLDMFYRGSRYNHSEHHIHAVMSRVAFAVEHDDTLSTLADVVEGLMWQKCGFELIDADEQDFWNQWARKIDLDGMLRKMGREEYKLSQLYVGLWWESATYPVQDDAIADRVQEIEDERRQQEFETKKEVRDAYVEANKNQPGFVEPPQVPEPPSREKRGNRKRKKKFTITAPVSYTIFDPTKVVPVGQLMFGRERFAYVATRAEDEAFSQVMVGNLVDGTVLQLIERRYVPTEQDRKMCGELGIEPDRLWLFKADACFRHTVTKADYERFASVRMETVLPILELKEHLRNSDRATLVGNTNFIVVITKGTDRLPAKPAEIENLQAQARTVARLPVLIGDHRLHVEIVAPAVDHTLQDSRWQVLDSRLVFTALRTFSPVTQGGNSSGAGVKEMSLVVAKGLESRRHMIIRSLERQIFSLIVDRNDELEEHPTLNFMPKRITLDFQADVIGQVLKLRDRGDISRETMLEELNYDEDTEVVRRGKERLTYDKVFESQTPYSSPATNPYGSQPPPQPGQPGQQPPGQPPTNLGPKGQPRTEGGRPPGATDKQPRKAPGNAPK